MKKILDNLRNKFSPKSFESSFEKLTKELAELCFEYVDYDSQNVEKIFIFCSTELDTIWFNTFYKINSRIVKKHKVGDRFNANDEKQILLNKEANKIIQKLIQNFKLHSKDLPSDFKIIYEIEGSKFDCKMSYEPKMEINPDITLHTICDEWIDMEKSK
ncbi:hypothetical protein Q4Q35_08705 [Flavivirga aquimarina]|uniref:DUF600 domain-containing protein n=1 Tax=Flavivirga aquimarina TaxID=2027862 RepID=A0ABT8W9R6_9FLAO|nr:hypothetical protein [Flavivirga aquimarina]MDO5969887.1 hypothetical protein [Flavivirga aquimarina]